MFWLFGCLARLSKRSSLPCPLASGTPFHSFICASTSVILSLPLKSPCLSGPFIQLNLALPTMSFQRVARASALRHLRLGDGLSHQTRVIGVQNQLRQLSLATNSRFTTPLAGSLSAVSAQQSHSFATDATKKTKTKSTTKKPKTEKKKPKRALTEKQKEAKEKKESRELVKQLKETALQPPKKLPQTARAIATQAKLKELREQSPSRSQVEIFKDAIQQVFSQRLPEADVCQH